MIRKLQQRFILITMAGIGFVFALILLALNIFMTISAQRQGYDVLENYANRRVTFDPSFHPDEISEFTDAFVPEEPALPPEEEPSLPEEDASDLPTDTEEDSSRFQGQSRDRHDNWFNDMRIFYVSFDTEGAITETSLGSNPDLTEQELNAIAQKLFKSPKERGSISGYLYLYQEDTEGATIYFLDYALEKSMSSQLFRICLWVGLAGILVILIPVIFLSRWVTRPVQLAFDKQKQFIADASHELKTPLTIITTNAEVLESSLSGNRWLSHILEQSDRMKRLINSLLELAKLDSYKEKLDFFSFDLSKTVQNAALSFESFAFEYGKTFTMEIEDGLSLYGNEERIRQLVTILLDNAFKYSDEHGEVLIRLSSRTDKSRRFLHPGSASTKKELLVRNSGKGISEEDQKHIFERFYRSDASRSRQSGGYGLGLAIAQSITQSHKGTIRVKSDGESCTSFYVTLP